MRTLLVFLSSTLISLCQTPAGGQPSRNTQSQRAPQNAPPVPNLSLRPSGSSLGTIRVGAADNNIWFGWRVGVPSSAFHRLTLSEALAKADTLPVTGVEASSEQVLSPEIPKKVDYRLQSGEREALHRRLRELNQQIFAYHIDNLGAEPSTQRKVFEFVKAIQSPLLVTSLESASLDSLEKLAEEFDLQVAFTTTKDPKAAMAALQGRSKRLGLYGETGVWLKQGVKPVEAISIVRDRLLAAGVRDRNAKGADVALGSGTAGLQDFFLALYRAELKPFLIIVEPTGGQDAYADLLKNLEGFERVMWPAMAARVRAMLDTPAGKIRGGDRLPEDMRAQIDAAVPRQQIVKPKKPRKLLVTDVQMYSGHSTIPHGSLMLELMGKYTGAFEPVFSNDPNLLKYPKIKEFDAVFLNNVCGMVHNDPEVREGILRFVKEGGGIGGNHAVTYANNNWPEFAEMMGGWSGAHHVETQVVKVDDSNSLLTKSFGPASFEHTDEFYHFPMYSPYSREKQHILLSLDVEKSDMATAGRFCQDCTRTDQDYGLAWIREYGKGRTYFTPLGHTTIMYTQPRWTQHMLAAIQYILGDLDADATPSAKLGGRKK